MSQSKLANILMKEIDELLEKHMESILKQNEIIISLLGRMTFTENAIIEIIGKNKQRSKNYLGGYNACDGEHSLSEIAEVIGVTKGTLSPILSKWEKMGIIYEIEKKGGKFYKKLFYVNPDLNRDETNDN